MLERKLSDLIVCFRGAGDLGSGAAWRLYQANIKKIVMLDLHQPLAVRRRVSFCEAILSGDTQVEGVPAKRVYDIQGVEMAWQAGQIAIMADPDWQIVRQMRLDVIVDTTLAKKNLGTKINDASLVIGVGPGFRAGKDVHLVVETHRGHDIGRIITDGTAEADTGVPGPVDGFSVERVLRAPCDGRFEGNLSIGQPVKKGEIVGKVNEVAITSSIDGVLRGLVASGTPVSRNMKIGDIDSRGIQRYCETISDKSRAIGGAVLEGVLRVYNV